MADVETTRAERDLIAHCIDLEGRRKAANRRRASTARHQEHRNYYCAPVGGPDEKIIDGLVAKGLMFRGHSINGGKDFYAYATDTGIKEVMV